MKRIEAADQPLYGRRTARLLFRPMSYRDAALFTPEYSARDRMLAYGVFGQLPGNLALQQGTTSLQKDITRHVLDPSGRLSDDAQTLLDAFLGDGAVYYSILQAVATGEHTWKGITSRVGRSGGSLSRPLQWLEEMGFIERVVPITEHRPSKSKRAQYRIPDPYIRFWHAVVSPLLNTGMLGTIASERLWKERVEPRMDDHMGMVFESACRDFVRHTGTLPFEPIRVGQWWNSHSTAWIDIVALGSNDELLVGECKWGMVSERDFHTLRQRAAEMTSELGFQPRETHYALFSGSGSADSLPDTVIDRGDMLWFNVENLYQSE